jgi:hypothetical protein
MVYVDELRYYPKTVQIYGHYWCHMWADSLEELLEFAKKIGLKPHWLQKKGLLIHFDLPPSRRDRALENGAVSMLLKKWFRLHPPICPHKSYK